MNPPRTRQGQGLSVNIIILIALGLIILVIAVLLVSKSGRNLGDNATGSCISKGGTCSQTECVAPMVSLERDSPGISATCIAGKPAGTPSQYCCRYNYGG